MDKAAERAEFDVFWQVGVLILTLRFGCHENLELDVTILLHFQAVFSILYKTNGVCVGFRGNLPQPRIPGISFYSLSLLLLGDI
jgi:hypothetical protein